VIECGTYRTADAVAQQPWLPDGPIPLDVQWTRAVPVIDLTTPVTSPISADGVRT
jgi:hypothetical protein